MTHAASAPQTTMPESAPPPLADPALGRVRTWLWALDAVSLFYVTIPTVLFVAGWLRLQYAGPLLCLLIAAFWLAWRSARPEPLDALSEPYPRHRRRMGMLALLVLFVVACTGIGGFTFQFYDYTLYNGALRDLIQYSWPIAYSEAGPEHTSLALVLYFGYWLMPALAGKMLGWIGAYYFNYLWASLGVFLITAWFLRTLGTTRLIFAVMLLFFGGMDIVGRYFSEGGPAAGNVSWLDYLLGVFWWSESAGWLDHWSSGYALTDPVMAAKAGGVFFRFYSPLSFLVDGPQHIVPGMVGFMMILHDIWRRQTSERTLFIWACLPICSVFVFVGSIPFVVLGLFEIRCRNLISFANAVVFPLTLIYVFYYSSAVGGRVTGWIWQYQNLSDTWWLLALHYVCEFALLAALIPTLRQPGYMPSPFWFLGALTMFVLAPFYRMGEYNDFASKIIVPAQFVFILLLAMGLSRAVTPSQRLRRAAMIVLLAIGALGPAGVIVRAFNFGMLNAPPKWKEVRHINEIEPKILTLQGKGDVNAPFWKYLAKEPVYRPTEPIYPTFKWDFRQLEDPLFKWIFFVEKQDYGLVDRGLHIRTQGNRPFLRRNDLTIDTDTVGQVEVKADIRVDGQPAKDVAIVVVWATPEQVAADKGDWPFQRWHANQCYPVRNIISTNSYWRGTVSQLAFYLRVPKGDERFYEMNITEIDFLER